MNIYRSNRHKCPERRGLLPPAPRCPIFIRRIITIILLLPLLCLAQSPIEVGAGESGDKLTGRAEIWHDPEGRSDIEEARRAYLQGDYGPLRSAGSTGLQPGAFWSRFALKNITDAPLTLHIEYVDHQLIGLQAFGRDAGRGDFRQLADLFLADPFSHRDIPHNRFVFAVTIPAGQVTEMMVRFSSDKKGFVFPSMRIWNPQALQANHTLETGAMAFLFGGCFLMAIFALVGGIIAREKLYFTYSAYSLSKVISWGTILGYTHQYLVTEHFHWSYMSISGAVAILCGLIFSRMFLRTRECVPKLDYLLRFMMANAAFLLVCALFKLTALAVLSITIALLLYPVTALVAFVRWRQGSREAAVFGCAWSVLVVALVMQALRDLGFVEHNLVNYYWPPVASFIEMLAIMAAMGVKVQRLQLQKEQAEHLYTQQLERSKSELEQLVQERTRELEMAKALAEQEARTDSLTGIHNRRSFFTEAQDRLKLAKRKHFPLSLLMFDIDHFKSINDNFGHAIGDDALRAFSDSIIEHTRDSDVFGRIGGEEFALLLLEKPEGTRETAQRLRADIEKVKMETPYGALQFTASIGIAHWDGESYVEELLHKADRSLYLAKKRGRNQIVEHGCAEPGVTPETA